ncbi:MAG TPA: DedA family protein [Pyrinomonadaceae bacterium]|nr:DedA family protein [Pyrinomonadaceae bacterium]
MDEVFFDLVAQYGLYAIFFLAMIEGDITLLLVGVLAHGAYFGDHSFLKVLGVGTMGGVAGDGVAYAMGRGFRTSVRDYKFYRAARPRIERLTRTFGPLSIFLSKYVYGLRTACCVFYGVGKMRPSRFFPLSAVSCFVWVLVLSGAGYLFHSVITNLIGDFERLGKFLLVIVVLGVGGFYLIERYWLSPRVEEADPERVQELEQAAEEKLKEIGVEIKELGEEIKDHLPGPLARRGAEDEPPPERPRARAAGKGDADRD